MHAYDFTTLNDKEFEGLAADLLSVEFGVKVERFKPGRDAGVDGRWFSDSGREIIIQCKHWARTGYDGLIRHLRAKELEKVSRLKPSRYILVTSVPLSRKNKAEIARVMDPWIRREDDVIGLEDLNSMLARNEEVERRNFKLWLSSSNSLGYVLNNAILGRSRAEVELMREEAALYVATQDHQKAWEHLEDRHVLIVTGEPGIGKTTLARQLAIEYVTQGFEFVLIEESVSEAEAIYSETGKQIFYFDDFLGRAFLEALKTREDSHVTTFMRRVARNPSKRFVLTSRTNILNQGAVLSDLYSEERVVRNTYTLEVGNLNLVDRARILYNHIWHSNLSEDYIDELYAEKRYHEVIKHDNFNPRLIAFILDSDKASAQPATSYWTYVQNTLRNPADVWSHFFMSQIDQDCRDLVYLTVLNGRRIKEEVLREAFTHLPPRDKASPGQVHRDFIVAMRHAVGSVLNRGVGSRTHEISYSLFNPSIADYVLRDMSGAGLWEGYYVHLRTLEALYQIPQMRRQPFFGDAAYQVVIHAIMRREVEEKEPRDEYSLRLATLLVTDRELRREFSDFLAEWILMPTASVVWSNPDEYITVLLEWRGIVEKKVHRGFGCSVPGKAPLIFRMK